MIAPLLITSLLTAVNPFDIHDLGCISDGQCYAMVINAVGNVAGYGDAPNGMSVHGFVWDGSKLVEIFPLNYPNGGQVWAYGINDAGDVVGARYAVAVYRKSRGTRYAVDGAARYAVDGVSPPCITFQNRFIIQPP